MATYQEIGVTVCTDDHYENVADEDLAKHLETEHPRVAILGLPVNPALLHTRSVVENKAGKCSDLSALL